MRTWDLWTFVHFMLVKSMGRIIHYLIDPMRIVIHDTQSDTYHDTLLFNKYLENEIFSIVFHLNIKDFANYFLSFVSAVILTIFTIVFIDAG